MAKNSFKTTMNEKWIDQDSEGLVKRTAEIKEESSKIENSEAKQEYINEKCDELNYVSRYYSGLAKRNRVLKIISYVVTGAIIAVSATFPPLGIMLSSVALFIGLGSSLLSFILGFSFLRHRQIKFKNYSLCLNEAVKAVNEGKVVSKEKMDDILKKRKAKKEKAKKEKAEKRNKKQKKEKEETQESQETQEDEGKSAEELKNNQEQFLKTKANRFVFKMLSREGDVHGKNISERSGKIFNISTTSKEEFVEKLKSIDFSYEIVDGKRKYNNKDINAFVAYRNNQVYSNDNARAVDMRFVATQLWKGQADTLTSKDYESVYEYLDACEKMAKVLIDCASEENRVDEIQTLKQKVEPYRIHKLDLEEKKLSLEKAIRETDDDNEYEKLKIEIAKVKKELNKVDVKIGSYLALIDRYENLETENLQKVKNENYRDRMHSDSAIKKQDTKYAELEKARENDAKKINKSDEIIEEDEENKDDGFLK